MPHILNVVAPVLLCVLLGFVWEKLKQPFQVASVTALITNIGFPALLISHLSEQHVSLAAFSQVLLAALAAVGCFGVIATALLKVLRLPLRDYFGAMVFGNVGNVGLPVAALAFGPKGMSFAIAFYVVVVVGVFTVGTWVPQGRPSFMNVIRAPTLYAVAIGLVLLATDTHLPRPIYHTFSILGGLAIPLMLLTLGYTIAGLKPGLMAQGFGLAVIHLVMIAGVAWSLVEVFDLQGVARGAFILQCLMPASVFNYLFVAKYDSEHAPEVASLVLFSTILTIVVLPFALAYWVEPG